jgi:hypothetical protein
MSSYPVRDFVGAFGRSRNKMIQDELVSDQRLVAIETGTILPPPDETSLLEVNGGIFPHQLLPLPGREPVSWQRHECLPMWIDTVTITRSPRSATTSAGVILALPVLRDEVDENISH